jgi:hypothetical protein
MSGLEYDRCIFFIFLPEAIFDLRRGSPEGVMISLKGTLESSLSGGAFKLSIKTVIRQFPLLKSIFHLKKNQNILDIKKISLSLRHQIEPL